MKESRHRIILQELDQTGVVSVKNLKELLNVTDMTIRRDLLIKKLKTGSMKFPTRIKSC